jgi:hypothetical protein
VLRVLQGTAHGPDQRRSIEATSWSKFRFVSFDERLSRAAAGLDLRLLE